MAVGWVMGAWVFGVVGVPLEGWTVEEINRLRVSGVWPDHAMLE